MSQRTSTKPLEPGQHPTGSGPPQQSRRGGKRPSAENPHKQPKLEYDPAEYELIRNLPRHFPRGPNDIFISLKTAFPAQMKRCQKLLEQPGCREIFLHGLGSACNRAVNLALQLQEQYKGLLEAWPTTGSLEITHQLEPLRDDLDPISQSRFISTIKIRVYYLKTLEDLQKPSTSAVKR